MSRPLSSVAREVFVTHKERYVSDLTHPCVKFVLDVLAASRPELYADAARHAARLQWGQLSGHVDAAHKDRQFRRYARRYGFFMLPSGEPRREGDVALLHHGDGLAVHVAVLVDGDMLAHLNERTRELQFDEVEAVMVADWMRK